MERGRKRKIIWKLLLAVIVVLFFTYVLYGYAFDGRTCGNSVAEIHDYLERHEDEVEILKISEKDRIKAVIYEREDLGTCYAVFEKKLFGLQLEHDGMDVMTDEGLQMGGRWRSGGLKGSKCDIIICGDNRDGRIASYMLADTPEVTRDHLEKDYILDIYIMDGIDNFPGRNSLKQYTAADTLFEK